MNFDEIDDETLFFIKTLGLYVRGRTLKSPQARAAILAEIRREEERINYESRCYPNTRDIQVYRECNDPIVYTIYPSFDGIKGLIQELGLPNKPDDIYCSIIARVGRLFKSKKKPFGKLQDYTIEEFGLRIGPVVEPPSNPDELPAVKAPPLPPTSQYKRSPRYRRMFGGMRLLQIWRTRIFPFPINSIQTNTSKPLTASAPDKIYFEEIWHPQRIPHQRIGGMEHKKKSKGLDIDGFYQDALRILGHDIKVGPKELEDAEQFERDVKDAYSKLCGSGDRRPSMGDVAEQLLMTRKTLRKYLTRFELDWPPKL